MRRSMTIITGSGHEEKHMFFMCPCEECKAIPTDSINIFYSDKHAMDSGWIRTSSSKYCEPGTSFVWVCPECAKKEEWVYNL